MIDGNQIKKDFPIYRHQPNLVYLDTTATSLKPQQVIDKENEYYTKYSANIFRGIYKISEKATEEYERVREKIAHFIGAKSAGEIVFVRNATEAINLVAAGVGKTLKTGDEIVTTIMEHHSNFVPWQQRALKKHIAYHVSRITEANRRSTSSLLGQHRLLLDRRRCKGREKIFRPHSIGTRSDEAGQETEGQAV